MNHCYMHAKHIIQVLIIVCLVMPAYGQNENNGYRYLYRDWGVTPKRDNYQFEVLKTALQRTVASHGEFQLERVVMSSNRRRSLIEVNLARLVNIRAGPWQTPDVEGRPKAELNIAVPVPIMRNLLGYRRIIVRKADVEKFNQIKRKADLKKLVAGQGRDWLDMKIYTHNNYAASDDVDLVESLIPMLVKKRFDYVPVSVIEIDSLLRQASGFRESVAEVDNITLYYPFPVIFYVSSKYPAMAERLRQGLLLMEQDGTFDTLLGKWFPEEILSLQQKGNLFFVLKNPYLTDAYKEQDVIYKGH